MSSETLSEGRTAGGADAPSVLLRAPAPRRGAKLSRKWLIAGLAGAVLVVGGVFYWRSRVAAPIHYVTAKLDRGTVSRSVTASGTVNPVLTIVVGSYVSGVIQDIACDYNTLVRKGQVCATIDPRPYQLTADQDRAAFETAKAQLLKDQASLKYATSNAQRYATLLAQDSTSKDAAENAANLRDQAKAQVALDEATIRQREAALHESEVNLSYTKIVSPVNGTVVSRNVTIGQTVAASFQTPTLFLIAQDLTKMQVDTNVSESDIEGEGRSIKVGDGATFTVDAFPGRQFRGVVSQVRQAPQTVQNVVTYDVVVAVDNPDLKLRPGMTATVKIVTDQRRGVLRAPNQALRYTPGGIGAAGAGGGLTPAPRDRVWVLKSGKPSPVAVSKGIEDDAFTEITGGNVAEGDAVIVSQTTNGAHRGASSSAPLPRL